MTGARVKTSPDTAFMAVVADQRIVQALFTLLFATILGISFIAPAAERRTVLLISGAVGIVAIATFVLRYRVEFDRRNHRAVGITYLPWLFALRVKSVNIAEASCISLVRRDVTYGDGGGATHYTIGIEDTNRTTILVCIGLQTGWCTARRLAESLSRFLNLPLHDSSLGAEVVDHPETVGLSLLEQCPDAERITLHAPLEPVCRVTSSLTGLEVIVPSAGLRGVKVFPMAIVLLFPLAGIALAIMSLPLWTAGFTEWVLYGAFFGIFLFIPLAVFATTVIREASETVNVHVSPNTFVIQRQWWLGKSTTTIPTESIRKLFVSKNCFPEKSAYSRHIGGVVTVFDHKWVAFGGHLPEPEQCYLCDVVKSVVTS